MTGETIWTAPYSDARGAAEFMAANPIAAVADGLLGQVHQAFAQRGDIVLLDLDGRMTLGVCVGSEVAAPADLGMVMMPMSAAVAAWKV
jgi:hypothetical protein